MNLLINVNSCEFITIHMKSFLQIFAVQLLQNTIKKNAFYHLNDGSKMSQHHYLKFNSISIAIFLASSSPIPLSFKITLHIPYYTLHYNIRYEKVYQ